MKNDELPRVVGTETEYDLTSGKSNDFLISQPLAWRFFSAVFPVAPFALKDYDKTFLTNGALVYADTGKHPEYATPECQSVKSLIAHCKAGQKLMERAEIFLNDFLKNPEELPPFLNQAAYDNLRRAYANTLNKKYYPIRIFRNNLSTAINPDTNENVSWGFHENYLRKIDTKFIKTEGLLIPFLISRQIYGGAGWLHLYHDKSIAFLRAQRPLVIHSSTGGSTTSARAVINTRNEPLADASKWNRLHLIMGDSNMSPLAEWLKIKNTAMVLDVIEDHEFTANIDFSDIKNPVQIFKKISRDWSNSWKFFAGGKYHTALSLQRFYLDLVRRYYLVEERKEADEETRNCIELWQIVLDLIGSSEFSLLAPFFDSFAKLYIFETILSRSGITLQELRGRELRLNGDIQPDLFSYLKQVDICYHRVYEKEGVYFIFQKNKKCQELKNSLSERFPLLKKEIVSEQDIDNAILNPPAGRAVWRKKIMELARLEDKTKPIKCLYPGWDLCRLIYSDDWEDRFSNPNPYSETTQELEERLAQHKNNDSKNI